MKQFSLEEYLANPWRKLVTRDGRKARIICTDAMGDYPLIALVEALDSTAEQAYSFTSKGSYYTSITSDNDLFFAPEKHEGWVCILQGFARDYYTDGIFDSEEKAKERGGCIATVKIEWEE